MPNPPSRLLYLPVLGLLLAACLPAEASFTPYPTFTPVTGFQILGVRTITPPATASPLPATPSPPDAAAPTAQPSPAATDTPAEQPFITLVFTGQIVPARCVDAETRLRGEADYIYEAVRDILTGADITVGTLNAAITDFPPGMGCVETFVLYGSSVQADAMANAGFDVMAIATNHIKNCGITSCGDRAFLDTLDNLNRVGILPVGGGLNLGEASAPVVVEAQGVRFVFVSLGQIEEQAFAGEDAPGIAPLTEGSLRAAIEAARTMGDVVIVLPHWGPEYSHLPNPSQLQLAQAAVDAGADLVMGNHTHYIQAFVDWQGIPVFFGLGNFVFDQAQEPQRQHSLIVRVIFQGSRLVTYEVIPIVNSPSGEVRVANSNEAVGILQGIQAVNAQVQEDVP
jgi:poly-gamma-glutamate synthesis protein (capsule biosynthesis protein)